MSHPVGSLVAMMIDDSFHLNVLLCSYISSAIMGSKSAKLDETKIRGNFLGKKFSYHYGKGHVVDFSF